MPRPPRTRLTPLETNWPEIKNPDGSDRENPTPEDERHLGHPTRPGMTDETVVTRGLPSPGNGQPGVPRIKPGRRKPGVMGGGFGTFPVNDVEPDYPWE